MNPQAAAAWLREAAGRHGFSAVGIARPEGIGAAGQRLAAALSDGHHGTMGWLADTAARRADPRVLWPQVQAVVMLGLNYGPADGAFAALSQADRGAISVYARHRDYHDILKGRLKQIAGGLVARAGGDVKVFVDTAPVMEKPLAAAAGLGWQGKHTNLVSRDAGSWLFLASLFTTLPLPPDAAETDHCGSCRACLDACPTNAFPAPYRLDARRCVSYLTIEHAGPIPRGLRAGIGNRIYGCDDCLMVCPWNKFAAEGREAKLAARADLDAPPLAGLAALDDAAFRVHFAGSPIKRTGRDRFVRNVLVAIGNSADPALAPAAEERLGDTAPLVRGAAVWALSRLWPAARFSAEAGRRLPAEDDPEVAAEWRAALDEREEA